LRETEKYLQKLGAKLQNQNAKSTDGRSSYVSETANDIEDESYQPQVFFFLLFFFIWLFKLFPANDVLNCISSLQHYLESNEKYYKLAHRYFMVWIKMRLF
jgi:hypothetical protein